MLARQGIAVVVLEKYLKRLGQPKAHCFNPRTMEIFRQIGMDTAGLRKDVRREALRVHFCSSMTGPQYGQIEINEDSEYCPEPFLNISQPRVEDYLRDLVTENKSITLVKGYEWRSCLENDDGTIVSDILVREFGEQRKITSKYLIGCDGSHSKTRAGLGIPFETLDNRPEAPIYCVSAHFVADLSHLPDGILWFILNPTSFGIFISYEKAKEWVYTIVYDPEITPSDSWTDEVVKEKMEEAMGRTVDYKIQSILKWDTFPKIAKTYRSPKVQNAFLAGDAAHAFPPTGGLGVNTGIADAQNLVWKIKAVEEGWASQSIFDTVTEERKPIADANSRQSKHNEEVMVVSVGKIFQILGESGGPEQLVQDPAKKRILAETIADNNPHFQSLNLQIGYVYGVPPLSRAPNDYRAENVPGARLPHAWIELNGEKLSTLDLVDGLGFVLLTSNGGFSELVAHEDGSNRHPAIRTYELDKGFATSDRAWVELMGLHNKGVGVVIRPDQHILGSVRSFNEVENLLAKYFAQ
jgi:2-polyprenyl-6-methoxyphenol hydroxylase-like FAD-dependent oxidoreductase